MSETSGVPDVVRLHMLLVAAGLPVAGVGRHKDSGEVRLDWSAAPGKVQEEEARRIVAGYDPTPPPAERLTRAGVGNEQVLAALWAKVVEKDEAPVEAILQALSASL